jgi:glutathione S-transferase
MADCSNSSVTAAYSYRFIYFDVRGAGELCRLVLTISGFEWADIRYPMRVSATGFTPGPQFRSDVESGAFASSMNKLPVLQVVALSNPSVAIATICQSHSIIRFIARQHGSLAGRNALEEAKVDAVYECCRDIKSEWYRMKRIEGGKMAWFGTAKNSTGDPANSSLAHHCVLLEKVIATQGSSTKVSPASPWCMEGPDPTIADIAIYHLLGTPMNALSGSTTSFFDGEKEAVEAAYATLPRINAVVKACSNLKSVQIWESKRPDTFA